MEKRVDSLVFRRMSYADFKHIHHKGSHYKGGGGQSYIDFPKIQIKQWKEFLGNPTGIRTQSRPEWKFKVHSFGLQEVKGVTIYNRRGQEVCISSQKIESDKSERVPSWHPKNQFPKDYDATVENLVLYIIKTKDKKYWAGWFLENTVPPEWAIDDSLRRMFDEEGGYIKFKDKVFVETNNKKWAFYFDAKKAKNQVKTEEDVEEDLLNEDTSTKLDELIAKAKPEVKERIIKIRNRNKKIVKKLKKLYKGNCQVSGTDLTFQKKNGEWYSEAHHLIALGENGSDSYANIIVLSPLIHRMLHYAKVSGINLSKIKDHKLKIQINGKDYEIKWHPDHLKTVEKSLKD